MSHYHNLLQQLCTIHPKGEASSIARWVMEERFGLSQTDLLLGKDSELSANDAEELQNITQRLLENEPIQYVLGSTTFCGLNIGVAPGVLIPRPETAELVEWIKETGHRGARLLDIGTGSGCIALALADSGFDAEAWDISSEALNIAIENAKKLGLHVDFKLKDILHINIDNEAQSAIFDIIVSNPPYICDREAAEMESNVLDYEPHTALFVPDDDPLLFYRAIAEYAIRHLTEGGKLFFEINRAYASETANLLKSLGFTDIEVRQDQFGNDRMIKATSTQMVQQ